MSAEKKIRVLIVDDSAFMRKVLRGIISADSALQVIGEARDGREAVSLAQSLDPDVITMDIMMPHVDGLEAIELIMSQHPRPIVIVSSESREGAASTLRGLSLGAIDFVAKPKSGVDLDMNLVRDELSRKLRLAAKVRVVRTATRPKSSVSAAPQTQSQPQRAAAQENEPPDPPNDSTRIPIVVITASTGGPATLMRLVPKFRKDFPAAVLAVLHMPAAFTKQFSAQLAEASRIRVKEAEEGEIAQPGTLYLCPGSHHVRLIAPRRISLDDGPRISGYRPCANVAMQSVAEVAGNLSIGVVLTGMGNDGAEGALAIKSAGGLVIAEDESTAVIFGMPAEAIKTGAVAQVLPIDDIYPALENRVLSLAHAHPVGVR
ncbi:MAG: chemotaxis response regulator protein-glutamate methylesterase [Candidatus Acidiferrales bacterium]